jgi:cell division protein FtsB
MNFLKYLMAIWTIIAVYTVSSFFVGATGISSYQQLVAERDKQRANIELLQNINKELEGNLDALKYDPDTIMIHARELGYGLKDEHFVRIVGLGGVKKQRIAAGQITLPRTPNYIPDKILWFFSFCAGLVVLLLLSISEFISRRKRRWRNYR